MHSTWNALGPSSAPGYTTVALASCWWLDSALGTRWGHSCTGPQCDQQTSTQPAASPAVAAALSPPQCSAWVSWPCHSSSPTVTGMSGRIRPYWRLSPSEQLQTKGDTHPPWWGLQPRGGAGGTGDNPPCPAASPEWPSAGIYWRLWGVTVTSA